MAVLLAAKDFARFERAAVCLHGRFELEAKRLTVAQLALAALTALEWRPWTPTRPAGLRS
ncbi:MAG TPA: hypothetical protein VFA43_17480 [Gemmatimonadaceae bacterium]|nr:hypothetical protein [Gemmatimonadaceae bacterium]